MKKNIVLFAVLIFVCTIGINSIHAQANLTGTWEGPTYVEGPGIDLMLTLEIKHEDGKITGRINDDLGYIDADITDVSFQDNVLKFTTEAQPPEGTIPMVFELKFENGVLDGKWNVGEGLYEGTWAAEKK